MTFLNAILAFGAAAFTIPLMIHLLHRSRYITVEWGAMHLLQSTKSNNSRQIHWHHLLLLLLRCLIPVLLALAMARPLIPSWQAVGGQSAMSLAIVLDDSTSMFAIDDALPTTRFARACTESAKILRALPAGSLANVYLAGSRPQSLSNLNPKELAIQLDQMAARKVPAGQMNIEESVQEAGRWLAESPNAQRQIILVSDLQTNEWKNDARIGSSTPAEWLAQQKVAPELSVLQIGPAGTAKLKDTKGDNLAIESVKSNVSLASLGKDIQITSRIVNFGDADCDEVIVVLYDNGFEIDRQSVSVAANGRMNVVSRWTPKLTGDHVLRSTIVRDDLLDADNSRSLVSKVLQPVNVLLVDGDRRSEPMQSETDFLRLALSPFATAQSQQRDTFATKIITPNELDKKSLEGNRVVCLCNVPNLTAEQQGFIRDFVSQGNACLVFLGDRVEKDSYNAWPTLDKNGLRLASLSARESMLMPKPNADATATTESKIRLQAQKSDFPPIRELSQSGLSALEKVQFTHRMSMSIEPSISATPLDASTVAQFDDDQPWVTQANLGSGRCIWISTAWDDDDSNLPTRSVFVPLVQRLFAFAARADSTSGNLIAGSMWSDVPEVATGTGIADKADKSVMLAKLRITKPDGTLATVETDKTGAANDTATDMGGKRRFEFSDTRLLGDYIARSADDSIKPDESTTGLWAASVSQHGYLHSSLNTSESQLRYLDATEAKTLAQQWKGTLSATADEVLATSRSNWYGREVWTWIWTALVVCFLAEIALEQWISPRLRASRVTKASGSSLTDARAA
jgi:hypothetical protein